MLKLPLDSPSFCPLDSYESAPAEAKAGLATCNWKKSGEVSAQAMETMDEWKRLEYLSEGNHFTNHCQ